MRSNQGVFAFICAVALSAGLAQNSFARDVEVIGSLKHYLKNAQQEVAHTDEDNPDDEIQLLHVELSDEAQEVLKIRAQDALDHVNHFSPIASNPWSLAEKVELGMNDVPVLDQGIHGTCVTFAVTAAVNALLDRGNYISQLCQLQLGVYLKKQGLGYNNWNGAYAQNVIAQMEQYGIANRYNQRVVGCGGYHHYPKRRRAPASYMDLTSFQEISEPVFGNLVRWTKIPAYLTYNSDPDDKLTAVKKALSEGDRVIFAVLLPRTDLGNTGAVGKYRTWIARDTWVLTPEIAAEAYNTRAAHELIITGYDDNAVASDSRGVKHKGLFTLRNSWGVWHGNWGEFYMSYDYFKLLTYDIQRFTAANK